MNTFFKILEFLNVALVLTKIFRDVFWTHQNKLLQVSLWGVVQREHLRSCDLIISGTLHFSEIIKMYALLFHDNKGSFFLRTIREWNALPPDIVAAKTPEVFKAQVSKTKY